MNEKLMFDEVRELCKCVGLSIDKISKDCSINQNLVAKMFLDVMSKILEEVKEDR